MDRWRSSRKLSPEYGKPLVIEVKEVIHNSPRELKYAGHDKVKSNTNIENKENSVPRTYKTLYNSGKKPTEGNCHNRYQTDHQIEKRALKAYSEFSDTNSTNKNNARYLDKTPKPTNYHNERTQEYWRREKKVWSQDYNNRDPSPVLMSNALKPSKKMPSYKPQPKLWAHSSDDNNYTSEIRPVSSQCTSPPLKYHNSNFEEERKSNKLVIPKKQIKYSRNKQSIDLKADTKDKALNTYQPNLKTIETVSLI